MAKYVELQVGPIAEDACARADLALRDVLGRDAVIVADVDQNH